MKTKKEILDYVVNYYKTNPRASTNGKCLYLTSDGRQCAHSICLDPDFVTEHGDYLNRHSAEDVIFEYGDDIHKPEFQEHTVGFWTKVQALHDDDIYWDKIPNKYGGQDLSEEGQQFVEIILNSPYV